MREESDAPLYLRMTWYRNVDMMRHLLKYRFVLCARIYGLLLLLTSHVIDAVRWRDSDISAMSANDNPKSSSQHDTVVLIDVKDNNPMRVISGRDIRSTNV